MSLLTVKILWAVIVLLISAGVMIVFVLTLRVIKSKAEKKLNAYQSFFESYLLEFIFDEDFGPGTQKWKTFVRDYSFPKVKRLERKALIQVMLAQHSALSGPPAILLEELYKDLNYHYISISQYWLSGPLHRAYLIHELSEFKAKIALALAKKNYKSRISILSEESLFALVKMGGPSNLNFLSNYPNILTDWQQTRLIHELAKFPETNLPPFAYLLKSPNQSVIKFGLELIQLFDELEAETTILERYDIFSETNKVLALQTAEKLGFESIYNHAKDQLKTTSKQVKLATLVAAGSLEKKGNNHWITPFISSSDGSISKRAAKSYLLLHPRNEAINPQLLTLPSVKQAQYETLV